MTTTRTGVFITPEYRSIASHADKIHAELVRRYGEWYDYFSVEAEKDPLYNELKEAHKKLLQLDEERRREAIT